MTHTKSNASHVITHCVTYKNYDNFDIQNSFICSIRKYIKNIIENFIFSIISI